MREHGCSEEDVKRFGILQRQVPLLHDLFDVLGVACGIVLERFQFLIYNQRGDIVGERQVEVCGDGYSLLVAQTIEVFLDVVEKH